METKYYLLQISSPNHLVQIHGCDFFRSNTSASNLAPLRFVSIFYNELGLTIYFDKLCQNMLIITMIMTTHQTEDDLLHPIRLSKWIVVITFHSDTSGANLPPVGCLGCLFFLMNFSVLSTLTNPA